MRQVSNILAEIRDVEPALRPSERKVAAFVLAEPARASELNLAAMAAGAGVSQPTVLRFCRALGLAGFPDFKIRLVQDIALGAPYVHSAIGQDDSLAQVADKIFASSIDALQLVRGQIELDRLEEAVAALTRAARIDLYGTGLSGAVALDAHQKLMRLGVPTLYAQDSHLQRMSAVTLGPRDVAIAFAYTGETRDIVRIAQTARDQGATVIAITRSGSALARAATITLRVDTPENTFIYAPMTTRLAQLAVVDTLSTAVALRTDEAGIGTIRRVKTALREEWLIDGQADVPAGTAARAQK